MESVKDFSPKAQAQGQRAKSAVGTEREEVPKLSHLDCRSQRAAHCAAGPKKFKTRVENGPAGHGANIEQVVEGLRPYLSGWLGYFGFCQTPSMLTNLEAWIRRRFRCTSGGSGERANSIQGTSPTRREQVPGCENCRFTHRTLAHVRTSGGTNSAAQPVFGSLGFHAWRTAHSSTSRTAVVRTRMPGGVGGAHREVLPYPDLWPKGCSPISAY